MCVLLLKQILPLHVDVNSARLLQSSLYLSVFTLFHHPKQIHRKIVAWCCMLTLLEALGWSAGIFDAPNLEKHHTHKNCRYVGPGSRQKFLLVFTVIGFHFQRLASNGQRLLLWNLKVAAGSSQEGLQFSPFCSNAICHSHVQFTGFQNNEPRKYELIGNLWPHRLKVGANSWSWHLVGQPHLNTNKVFGTHLVFWRECFFIEK